MIESIEIEGGFLDGLKAVFVWGLNAIIGDSGAGKTTLLELLRWVLGDEESAGRLDHELIEANLGKGTVRVRFRTQDGAVLIAERSGTGPRKVLDERGKSVQVPLDRDLFFKLDSYATHEIERIAGSPSLQLELLDRFAGEGLGRINAEIRKVQRELEVNAADLVGIAEGTRDLEDTAEEIRLLDQKLQAMQPTEGKAAKTLAGAHAAHQLREQERRVLGALNEDLAWVRRELERVHTETAGRLSRRLGEPSDGPNREEFLTLGKRVRGVSEAIEEAAAKLRKEVGALESELPRFAKKVSAAHSEAEKEYRLLLERSDEGVQKEKERSEYQRTRAELAEQYKDLAATEIRRKERTEQRERLLEKLEGWRAERYALRAKVAHELTTQLDDEVRVEVSRAGDVEEYKKVLRAALEGKGFRTGSVVDEIAPKVAPDELVGWVRDQKVSALVEETDLSEERAHRVVEALRGSPALLAIEAVDLEDVPVIKLKIHSKHKDSKRLSSGQRCVALLPLLLAESNRPLLIDQPEQNLGNRFIYEHLIEQLQEAQKHRQMIFVTHAANVPVLGGAKRVFLLEYDEESEKGRLQGMGSFEELRDEVGAHLEGAKEAYKKRGSRYGW